MANSNDLDETGHVTGQNRKEFDERPNTKYPDLK